MGKIANKLSEFNIVLPKPILPVANYSGFVTTGNLVFISGQLPIENESIKFTGRVGLDASLEIGYQAARLCGINIITQLNVACNGDLDSVTKCIQLSGFVNAINTFKDHPKVINGCSDLIVEVFGTSYKHTRTALGVSSLPLNALVEISAIFEIQLKKTI